MRRKSWVFGLSLFILLGSILSASQATAELVDRIIAYVNDDIITLSELNEKTKAFVDLREQNPFLREKEQSVETIRRGILDHLIDELLAEQEVSRLKISVSATEVDDTITRLRRQKQLSQEAFAAEVRKQGKTLKDVRQQIRKTLEQRKLINREVRNKTVITDEIVEDYYQAHIQDYQGKERRRLQDIFLPYPRTPTAEDKARIDSFAQQILKQLGEAADFASLAKRYSRGPGAEAGGDLGFFSKGELDPVLEKAIDKLESGETSPAIKTEIGVHIIKVAAKDKTPARSLDDVQESIRDLLYQREVDFRYREWLSTLRKRSYVKIVY
jgi:peptidyl-prolyl cis-trans isomerase SurA